MAIKTSHRKERIWLRFACVPPSIVSELKRDLSGAKIKTDERRVKDKNTLAVLLELDASIDCDTLCQFIERHKIPTDTYSIRVSIVTEQYMDGVLVPQFVTNLLCRLRCELSFTFTKM